ncbi:MAG TPA: glycosyltransferase family 87 protein [Bryobacteraceae bacterium]|nr:glycosyltransferase family 87 protein [Bryobacteraceae bacterium]
MDYLTKPQRRRLVLCGLLAAVVVVMALLLTRNIDFRVYWYGATAVFDGSRPLYGPASGLGFPMHYRYPPVTYLLLWPLSRLPLYWAGVIWMVGAWTAAIATAALAIRTERLNLAPHAVVAACGYLLAYVVLALRSGNVQPYLIAMIFAALLLSESHRVAAASLLGLAITFKIWPVFFLPWFLHRRRRLVLVWLIPVVLLLWLFPLTIWSPSDYVDLLRQWYRSEFQSATTPSESWYFPGQSLRGVLLRYLTAAAPWIPGFPDVHLLSLPPRLVVRAWQAAASMLYAIACIAMLRCHPSKRWVWDGLSFSLFTLLEPFCLKSGMISLGPAVLVAAALYSEERQHVRNSREAVARRFFLAACALSLLGAIAQYKPLLRLLLALGLDFYAAVMLLLALLLWALSWAPFFEVSGDSRYSRSEARTTSASTSIVRTEG